MKSNDNDNDNDNDSDNDSDNDNDNNNKNNNSNYDIPILVTVLPYVIWHGDDVHKLKQHPPPCWLHVTSNDDDND